MEIGLGVLKWSPDQFWRATPYETSCAYIGNCKATGTGRWAVKETGWSDAQVEEFQKTEKAWMATLPDVIVQ